MPIRKMKATLCQRATAYRPGRATFMGDKWFAFMNRQGYGFPMTTGWQARIVSDPLVLRGKPCIRGTRIPVALILGYLAAGKSHEQIVVEFPDLTSADIAAALEYARDLADFDAVATS